MLTISIIITLIACAFLVAFLFFILAHIRSSFADEEQITDTAQGVSTQMR